LILGLFLLAGPVYTALADTSPAPATAPAVSFSTSSVTSLPAAVGGTASGYHPHARISYHLDNPAGPSLAGSPSKVGPDGASSFSVTIPAGVPDGTHDIYVVGVGS
jgi:hypothetical protein